MFMTRNALGAPPFLASSHAFLIASSSVGSVSSTRNERPRYVWPMARSGSLSSISDMASPRAGRSSLNRHERACTPGADDVPLPLELLGCLTGGVGSAVGVG